MFPRHVHPIRVGAIDITVVDDDPIYQQLCNEIPNAYNFETIPFEPGDVMLDIGAHVGLTSIYYAKIFPQIQVYSYEPVKSNYDRLLEHLSLNGVGNVEAHNLGVTSDGKTRKFIHTSHTAGCTAYHDGGETFTVKTTTMDAIFKRYAIKRVRLLKLDCEGAEFEILGTAGDWLDRVDAIRGEFHPLCAARSPYDPIAVSQRVANVNWVSA